MKKWLFNPFIYVAGWQALSLGLILMALTAVIAFFSQTHFDGAIDLHVGAVTKSWFYLFEPLNAWLSTALVLFCFGNFLSKSKIRFVDVAGTLALARAPMLIAAIIGFVPIYHRQPSEKDLAAIAILGIVMLLFSVWMIALSYNAFTVSCNLKGSKASWGFVAALIVTEVVSKVVIHQVYQHFSLH